MSKKDEDGVTDEMLAEIERCERDQNKDRDTDDALIEQVHEEVDGVHDNDAAEQVQVTITEGERKFVRGFTHIRPSARPEDIIQLAVRRGFKSFERDPECLVKMLTGETEFGPPDGEDR
jgi:hypothetical protein